MTEELIKKIEEHLSTFPIRNKELEEMKEEWRTFQSKISTALYTALFLMVAYGIWVGTIQTTMNHMSDEQIIAEKSRLQYETRLGALEVNNGEIKVKLANIEATLQEIKIAIQKIK